MDCGLRRCGIGLDLFGVLWGDYVGYVCGWVDECCVDCYFWFGYGVGKDFFELVFFNYYWCVFFFLGWVVCGEFDF